jgi:hypothetical protein
MFRTGASIYTAVVVAQRTCSGRSTMSSESVCQVAHSWVTVGSKILHAFSGEVYDFCCFSSEYFGLTLLYKFQCSRRKPSNCTNTGSRKLGRDISVGIATLYLLDGPGIETCEGAILSDPVHTAPGTHPASYAKGISFPGAKLSVCDIDQPPQSSGQVKERVKLYIYSPSGFS